MTENLENNIKEELSNWNELKDKILNIIPSKDISFKTRSLLSQILSRLELTNQDRLDLEKYITFGGGENLDTIITSDWNAREGEAGYIKNKPLTIPNDDIEYYTAVEFIELEEPTEDEYRFVSIRPIEGLTDEDSLIVKTFYSSVSDTEYKDDIYHFSFKEQIGIYEFTFDSVKVVLNFDNNFIEFRTNVGDIDRGEYLYKFTDSDIIYKIESCYIPDTIARKTDIPEDIIKTTPQELTDDDKNQALTNLGIDPVVIKYLANPYIIEDMTEVPTELLNDEDGYKYMNPNMYLFKRGDYIYTAAYCDINFIHFNDGTEVYIDNGKWSAV